jgi:hypothetical protein
VKELKIKEPKTLKTRFTTSNVLLEDNSMKKKFKKKSNLSLTKSLIKTESLMSKLW